MYVSKSQGWLARPSKAYGFAAIVTVVCLACGLALRSIVDPVPRTIFVLVIGIVTHYAGRGPAVVALLGSAVLGHLAGLWPNTTPGLVATVFLLIAGAGVIWVISSLERTWLALAREHDRREILQSVSAELDQSLDYRQTIPAATKLIVPRFADWCAVLIRHDGELERVATVAADPGKLSIVADLGERNPIEPEARHGAGKVLRTGEPELVPYIDQQNLAELFPDPSHREKLRTLDIRSYVCAPIQREDRVLGVITLAMSESGRVYAQDDLQLVMLLASRIAIAIENAQLFQTAQVDRASAQEANRAKDDFLAMLGHELRNPLAPIRTALELMKLREPDALVHERTVIDRQVSQLVALVDDLLDVARIARGLVELHRRPVSLLDVVAKGVETASPLVESRQHELRIDIDPRLVVDGDPLRLAQVVANLVTNAAKYTAPHGTIEVTGQRRGDSAVLAVRDTGIGIPADMLSRVFDTFVQAPQAIDRAGGGLGLGLTIVKSFVELHGGKVTASSNGPGAGTVFEVVLPLLAAQPAVATAEPPPEHVPRRGRVLVVDDNPDALSMLADALEQVGYTTARAHDGPSALAVAADLHPDVALLDIGLPVMDGYELARRLREVDAGVKLVAVTGYGRPGDFDRSQRAGFAAHLVKPISISTVESTLDRLVTSSS
ncbi:MAG: Histidine kinase [Myxococcales bacterium]|nr:Histidine kinase [Myxococcales bacterium]